MYDTYGRGTLLRGHAHAVRAQTGVGSVDDRTAALEAISQSRQHLQPMGPFCCICLVTALCP